MEIHEFFGCYIELNTNISELNSDLTKKQNELKIQDIPFNFVANISAAPYAYRGSTSVTMPSGVTILTYSVVALYGDSDMISPTLGGIYANGSNSNIININAFSNINQTIRGYLRVLYYE